MDNLLPSNRYLHCMLDCPLLQATHINIGYVRYNFLCDYSMFRKKDWNRAQNINKKPFEKKLFFLSNGIEKDKISITIISIVIISIVPSKK